MAASKGKGSGGRKTPSRPRQGAAAEAPPRPVPTPRRRGGFVAAGHGIAARLGRAAERQGFAEPEVLLRWEEILGPALAGLCRPVRMSHGRGRDLACTLIVAADGPAALEVEHRAPQIIERVNACFGYRHVTGLKVTQAVPLATRRRASRRGEGAFVSRAPSDPASPPDFSRGEPHAEARHSDRAGDEAARAANGIVSEELRDAISVLGGYILIERGEDTGEDGPARDRHGSAS